MAVILYKIEVEDKSSTSKEKIKLSTWDKCK